MIVGILYVIVGIFWAFVCGEEVRKKNYDPTAWYVLGFIFGGLAYLVAWWFIKPKIKEVDKVDIERIVQADKARAMKGDIEAGRVWICPVCRNVNDSKVYACPCGERKPPRVISHAVTKPVVETWICNNCGMENSGHVFICNCGMKKSENEKCKDQQFVIGGKRKCDWFLCCYGHVCGRIYAALQWKKKRRESSAWYVLGFLFGVFAYIITLFIKPREPEFDEIEIQRRIAEDKVQAMKRDISTGKVWVCPQCGKMNDRYETICSCGTAKPIRERL